MTKTGQLQSSGFDCDSAAICVGVAVHVFVQSFCSACVRVAQQLFGPNVFLRQNSGETIGDEQACTKGREEAQIPEFLQHDCQAVPHAYPR